VWLEMEEGEGAGREKIAFDPFFCSFQTLATAAAESESKAIAFCGPRAALPAPRPTKQSTPFDARRRRPIGSVQSLGERRCLGG